MRDWTKMEAALRERAYRKLNADPQILFETDGGPVGQSASLIYARLFGFEDEIAKDGLRLSSVLSHINLPIPARPLLLSTDAIGIRYEVEPARVARYELQSGFVRLHVAAEFAPQDVRLEPDFTASVLYLRYRRRA